MDNNSTISVDLIFNDEGVAKGVDKINKKFQELLKNSTSLSNVNSRIKTSLQELDTSFQNVGKSMQKMMPTKGGFDVDKFIPLDKLQQLPAVAQKSFESFKQFNPMSALSNDKEIAQLEANFNKVAKVIDKDMKAIGRSMARQANHAKTFFKPIDDVIGSINKKLEPATKKFAGWAMSIMFFGMAMQRVFNGIWKSSTQTFQDVMHSTEGATTGFDMLQGSIKYLQFSIGAALEPVVMWLIPIIDRIAEWVQNNEGLTAGIITIGILLGGLFVGVGGGVLAINGFIELGEKIGLLPGKTTTAVEGTNTALGGIKSLISVGVALYFVKEALEAFKEENYMDMVADLLIAAGSLTVWKMPWVGGSLLAIGFTLKFIDSNASQTAMDWMWEKVYNPILKWISSLIAKWDGFVQAVKSFGVFNVFGARARMNEIYKEGVDGLTSSNQVNLAQQIADYNAGTPFESSKQQSQQQPQITVNVSAKLKDKELIDMITTDINYNMSQYTNGG
jgi:hypothetical protein